MLMKQKNKINKILIVIAFVLCQFSFLPFDTYIMAEEIKIERPPIEMDAPVEITVDLEDDSRFMKLALYKIAEYQNGRYQYISPYDEIDIPKYYKLSRESERAELAEKLVEYIADSEIEPEESRSTINGVWEAKGKSVGVYLIMQADGDCNAKMNAPMLVEVPRWSDENAEYMYNLHLYPKWDSVVWFAFRPEVVYPTLVVLTLILSLALCLFGLPLLRSVLAIACALVVGMLGMKLGIQINSSFIGMMVFFVTFAFIGLGIFLILSMLVINPLKKMQIYGWVQKWHFIMVPLIGSSVFAVMTYYNYMRNALVIVVLWVALSGLSMWLQYLKRDDQIIFYTYDDLIAEKLDEENAE